MFKIRWRRSHLLSCKRMEWDIFLLPYRKYRMLWGRLRYRWKLYKTYTQLWYMYSKQIWRRKTVKFSMISKWSFYNFQINVISHFQINVYYSYHLWVCKRQTPFAWLVSVNRLQLSFCSPLPDYFSHTF